MKAAMLARTALSSALKLHHRRHFPPLLASKWPAPRTKTWTRWFLPHTRLNLNLLPEKSRTPLLWCRPAAAIKEQGVTDLAGRPQELPGITLNARQRRYRWRPSQSARLFRGRRIFPRWPRDTGLDDHDVFDYQSLEVLKGPASTLFGRGTTGGVINQVSKAPGLYPIEDFLPACWRK